MESNDDKNAFFVKGVFRLNYIDQSLSSRVLGFHLINSFDRI